MNKEEAQRIYELIQISDQLRGNNPHIYDFSKYHLLLDLVLTFNGTNDVLGFLYSEFPIAYKLLSYDDVESYKKMVSEYIMKKYSEDFVAARMEAHKREELESVNNKIKLLNQNIKEINAELELLNEKKEGLSNVL